MFYSTETSKTILDSEVRKYGKRRVRTMLTHQGYTRDEVLRLVPNEKPKRK